MSTFQYDPIQSFFRHEASTSNAPLLCEQGVRLAHSSFAAQRLLRSPINHRWIEVVR